MAWDFWVALGRFLWWRDTESAFCLILWLELYLDTNDVHMAGSYFRASHEVRREQEAASGQLPVDSDQ